ncbi:MAG: hypothetical protein KME22_26950 [Hassallia sp. WJT32-NPBG1]|jgi:hypothetical protein|nr:hypothetical protein [Hassallia sp. WJT32-NPBG1]
MTQSVDQTSITDVTSRRHNDPPGLWIAVVTSSVALHLLVFWLMRSSNAFSPWFPRASQAAIPIEIIEISPTESKAKPPKPQLKAKTVSPRSANQQSSAARSTQESPVTPKNQNSGGINFAAIRKQRERNTFASKPDTKLVPKKSVPTSTPRFTSTPEAKPTPTATPRFTPEPIPTPTPIPTPKPTSFGNLPWKRLREEISLGKPTPLPTYTPEEPRQPTVFDSLQGRTPRQPIDEDSQIPNRTTPRQPIDEDSQIPNRRTPRQPIDEDSQTPNRRTPRQPIDEDSQITNRRTPRQPIDEDSQTPNRTTPRQPIDEDSQIPNRTTPRQPIDEDSQTPNRRTPRQPIDEDSQIPNRTTPRQPIDEDSQITPTQKTPQPPTGGLIAISRFVTPDEQRSLMRNPPPKDLILPEHIGSNEKQINSVSLQPNLDLPEKEFLVSLVIDKAGNFVQAEVVDPAIASGERDKYEQFANQVFQDEKFQPARSTNGTPVPDQINRFVHIKIQRR